MSQEHKELAKMRYITTNSLVGIVIGLFVVTQITFLVVTPSEVIEWNIAGWILSTNIAAVILTIIGNREVEKARALSQKVYTPELTEAVIFAGKLKTAIDAEMSTQDDDIIDVAPALAVIIKRIIENKTRLEKLKNIKDDEVFMSAVEEVTRNV
jgi:hypothetical protein